MIKIDDILIDEDILKANFSCDLVKCKGACCTFPGKYGAPLNDNEVEKIKDSFSEALDYLSPASVQYIEKTGFIEGKPGHYTTMCIDARDCVFVFYEEGIAKCALEKAFFDGKTKFRKPVSCHLFPVREGNFGGKYLYYERIKECSPAISKGEKENTKMPEFVKDALIRAYGRDWFDKLKIIIEQMSVVE
ncbi:MAG: DUF3109 family protein [Bacteroidota bacterium]